MPRAIKDARLETRTARAKLLQRREPYWRSIDRGAHLGYRKATTGGFWIARKRSSDGAYRFTSLGSADDARESDGADVLDFYQAQEKARGWFVDAARDAGERDAPTGPYTVADAITDYLAWYKAHRKRSGFEYASNASDVHILPELGKLEVAKLTARRLRTWHQRVAEQPTRLRSAKGRKPRHKPAPQDEEAKRRRRATANRVLTVLKAALNRSFGDGLVSSDQAWRRVRPFRNVGTARIRYLSEDECVRLVNASAPDLRALVRAALLTGCRYGELIAMRCDDYHPDSVTVLVREAKSDKARHVVLSDEGRKHFERVTAGRPGTAAMFVKADGEPWRRWHQRRPMLEATAAASIDPPATFHVLRHTHASQLAMRGVPLQVIAAQLGHADTRICEKHYAHLAPSYVADVIRANMPTFGIVSLDVVTPLWPKRASERSTE